MIDHGLPVKIDPTMRYPIAIAFYVEKSITGMEVGRTRETD